MNIFMGRQQPMQAQRTGGPMQPQGGRPTPGVFGGGFMPMQPQQQAPQQPILDRAGLRSYVQSMMSSGGQPQQMQPAAPVAQAQQMDPRSTIASLLMKGGR